MNINQALIKEKVLLDVDVSSPYYIGAKVTVEQTEDGAKITATDREGTTTAIAHNGVKGDTGAKGDTGNGISDIEMNSDYTLTIGLDNGDSYTTPPIRGEKGETGDAGEMPFYEEIVSYKERNYNTDCYFSTVPTYDNDGNLINFYVDYVADKNPLEQAGANHTSITVNGNATLDIGEPIYRAGITISNGEIINSRSFSGYSNPNPMYVGIKQDRTHVDYQMNTAITPSEMLADGCWNVFNCYFKLVEDGEVTDLTNRYWNDYVLTEDDEDVLMLLGFKANNDIVLMACDGRSSINDGLTAREGGELMIAKGCVDVYYLDGGGSTCLVVNGSKFNRNIDGGGTVVRPAHYTLNVKKPVENIPVADSFSKTGVEKQRLIEQIIPNINYLSDMFTIKTGVDLDTISETCFEYIMNAVNSPSGVSAYGYCVTICSKNSSSESVQMWTPYNTSKEMYIRKFVNGQWGSWVFWHSSIGVGDNIIVGDGQYGALVYGDKVYLSVPISGCFISATSSASWSTANNSGLTLYQNGNILAGSSTPIKPTIGVVRTKLYTGFQIRFDIGSALTSDPNYVNYSAVIVELNGLVVRV